jgi:chromosome segregation ATPase
VNRFLAEDKRKHQTALAQVEAKLQEALADKTMTEATRKALEENLTAIQGQLRTKEQQLAHEKKQMEEVHTTEVVELKKKVQVWESLYRDSTVERALQDAAVKGDAFNAEQIVVLLRPMTKLLEVVDERTGKTTGKYKPMVEMSDVDPKTGEPVQMVRTPEEAVKRMKELPDTFGNLFKSGVVSGIGAGTATGGAPGGGRVDVRKLTPQQYRELREKNPELLGLRPKRKPR